MYPKKPVNQGCAMPKETLGIQKELQVPMHEYQNVLPTHNMYECCPNPMPMHYNPCCAKPTVLKPICKVIHEYDYHNIQHIQPIHTHVVKNHVNIHETVPKYTYSTEDKCCDKYK